MKRKLLFQPTLAQARLVSREMDQIGLCRRQNHVYVHLGLLEAECADRKGDSKGFGRSVRILQTRVPDSACWCVWCWKVNAYVRSQSNSKRYELTKFLLCFSGANCPYPTAKCRIFDRIPIYRRPAHRFNLQQTDRISTVSK